MKENLLVSFSGGKTSAFMTHHILNNLRDRYNILVGFSNTGQEDERSLEFVRDCDVFLGFNTVWVEAVINEGRKGTTHKVIDFTTASRNGEPFEAMIQKYGIPNRDFPHCTRELKIRPLHSYAKEYFKGNDYVTAIGIRADEVDRIQKGAFIYPLIKMGVTKQTINDYWHQMYFTLRLPEHRGNCVTCWKKSFKKLKMLADEGEGKWVQQMEDKYGNFIPESQKAGRKLPVRFFREHKTWYDIKNLKAKEAKDEIPNGCSESCEAF